MIDRKRNAGKVFIVCLINDLLICFDASRPLEVTDATDLPGRRTLGTPAAKTAHARYHNE